MKSAYRDGRGEVFGLNSGQITIDKPTDIDFPDTLVKGECTTEYFSAQNGMVVGKITISNKYRDKVMK